MVVLEQDLLFGAVRRLPLRLTDSNGEQEWALSAALLAAHLGVEAPVLDGQVLAVGVTRNSSHAERMALPPVARPSRIEWDGSLEAVQGKAVLVGVVDGHADALRSPSGLRYGVEIHAAAAESLARQKGLRGASPVTEALLALLVGLFTALGAQRLGPRRRRWAFGLGAGTLVLLVGALKAGMVFSLSPVLLASLLGVYVGGRA